jgi:hypothetical protein
VTSETQKSISQLIYESFQKGEISLEQMQAQMAHRISESLYDHAPVNYAEMPLTAKIYIDERDSGTKPRDPAFARKNGDWILSIIRVYELNKSNYETLVWAKDLCIKNKLREQTKKIIGAMKKHADNPPPTMIFKNAIKVQEMDADERRRQ